MEFDEPKFVQAAPESAGKALASSAEEKVVESGMGTVRSGWGRQLKEDEIDEDADGFLCWIVRYPVERNHPRPTTGTIAVQKGGDAVVCSSNDKIVDVLQRLIVEGFLSVPVVSAQDSRLIGYLDLLDIVWFVMYSFGAWREEVSKEKVLESKEKMSEFLTLERFRSSTVLDVMGRPGFGTRNEPHHVYRGFSLFHVVETMARIGAHRLAICNSERKVTGLITQSMVISLLDQHLDRLGTIASNHTVEEIIPGLHQELKLVNETDMALSAFKLMVQQNINGIAVVNSSGVLVDTISVRDLRGMGVSAEDWTALWMSCKDFKAHCRAKFKTQTPDAPIYVTKTDTLETIIKKMDDGNIHRVFVCEEKDGKPIPTHCISQRDVLRFALYMCGLKNTSLEDLERAQEVS